MGNLIANGDGHYSVGSVEAWPTRNPTLCAATTAVAASDELNLAASRLVEDADKLYQQAIQAGATVIQEIATQYYGDRSGGVQDCCGNQWWVATRVEDVALEELERRAAAATH